MKRFLKKAIRTLFYLSGFIVALFIILYLVTSGKYTVAKTAEEDPSIAHVTINQTVFHAETYGNDSNEVIIVIHGGPGNDYRYLLDLKELADEYFVVFYDQRGTGLSPRVTRGELSLDTTLADLAALVDHYAGEEEVILIGHSWGAMLAAGYIAKNPGRVSKAVLAEPGMLTSEKAREYMNKFRITFTPRSVCFFLKTWFQQLHIHRPDRQAGMDYFFAQVGRADIPGNPMANYFCHSDPKTASMDYWRYSWLSSQEIIRKGMDEEGNLQIDLVSGLENYHRKVLFLAGECNTIIGPKYQEDHMKYFPEVEMVIIPDAGHTMIGEKPEESIAAIRKYLNE